MDLRSLLDTVASTPPDGWHRVPDVTPPVAMMTAFGETKYGGDERYTLEAYSHHELAVLIADPSISIAWGMKADDDLEFEFRFADNKKHSVYADVLLTGALVHREPVLVIDGGRAYLPFPRTIWVEKSEHDPMDGESIGNAVTEWEHAFVRLVDVLRGAKEFDKYFERAGFIAVPGLPLDPHAD